LLNLREPEADIDDRQSESKQPEISLSSNPATQTDFVEGECGERRGESESSSGGSSREGYTIRWRSERLVGSLKHSLRSNEEDELPGDQSFVVEHRLHATRNEKRRAR